MERARVFQKISFCDRVADNVVDETLKRHVFSLAQAAAPRRVSLAPGARSVSDAAFLTERSNGNPYLLVLAVVHGIESAFFVDRKVNRAGEYILPRIVRAALFFPEDVYPESGAVVIDGEMVRVPQPGQARAREWRFLVNGVVGPGRSGLVERLAAAAAILERRVRTPLDPCVFECKRVFAATPEGAAGLAAHLQRCPYLLRGVYAWSATGTIPTMFPDPSRQQERAGPGRLEKGRILAPAADAGAGGSCLAAAARRPGESLVDVRSTEIPDRYLLPDGSLLAVPGAATSALLRAHWGSSAPGTVRRLVVRGAEPVVIAR